MNNYSEFLSMEKYIEHKQLIEEYKSNFKNITNYIQKFIVSTLSMTLIVSYVLVESLLSKRAVPFFKWYAEDSSLLLKMLFVGAFLVMLSYLYKTLSSLRTFHYLKHTEVVNKVHLLVVDSIKGLKTYESLLNNTYYNEYWELFEQVVNDLENIPKEKKIVLMEKSNLSSTLKSRLLILDLDTPQNKLSESKEITIKPLFTIQNSTNFQI